MFTFKGFESMQYGIDSTGNRNIPTSSGQKATCPFCNGVLIAKCGEIYVKHWQHSSLKECDSWHEPETLWHRNWKSNFPESWREVIVYKFEKKHIADIQTPNGLVIEFQNSSISTATIKAREEFYQNILWVVNAISFKDNFELRSVVNSKLRQINKKAYKELSDIEDYYTKAMEAIVYKIQNNENKQEGISESINYRLNSTASLNTILKQPEVFNSKVIEKWENKEFYYDPLTYEITSSFNSSLKKDFLDIPEKIKKKEIEIENLEKGLISINKLDSTTIGNKIFKCVEFKQISPESFSNARAILKSTRNTIFPEIKEFKNELDFQLLGYKQELYDFFIDPTDKLNLIKAKILEEKRNLADLIGNSQSLTAQIKAELIKLLENKIQEKDQEIINLNFELEKLIEEKELLITQKAQLIKERNDELKEAKEEIEKAVIEKRYKIMREQKGKYTFEWKHERKSWRHSSKPIYFDIGEDYLFEKINNSLFIKTPKKEFLAKYLKL
ncbi:competence protein CoiA [Adhaeribacter soli]|uniref:Competence protein n=1 Tax=Adhaeribacter soli TaxID=2607655 RepID=A0A5N1IHS6_9BACT|nr:hypothetical protein [Adhaeribacter soli]KAA9324938.1 hypothetical protein F0P94_19395 [Adhaeribacter soli]